MDQVAVVGATGFTGQLIAAVLAERGHRARLVVRDRDRLAATALDACLHDVEVAEITDPTALRRALDGTTVVISAAGPFVQLGPPVVDAAAEVGAHYIDITGEQAHIRWLSEQRHALFAQRGIAAVPAVGFDFVPGQLAGAIAATQVSAPTAAHVAYAVGRSPKSAPRSSSGTRATVASMLGQRGVALVDGRLLEEWPAEARRLAWFPQPLGPCHAAGIPAAEAILLPRVAPTLRTVRTYLALKGWQAESLQAAAWLGQHQLMARPMRRLITRSRRDPLPAQRAATRWSAVAEVAVESVAQRTKASGGRPEALARAWVAGVDMYGFTAHAAVLAAERLQAASGTGGQAALPGIPSGVIGMAELGDPAVLLDDLGERAGIRWGVIPHR